MGCSAQAGDIAQTNHQDYTSDVSTSATSSLSVTKVACADLGAGCAQQSPGHFSQDWNVVVNTVGYSCNVSLFTNSNGGITQAECQNNQLATVTTSYLAQIVAQVMSGGQVTHLVAWLPSPFTVISVVTWFANPCA